MVLCKRNIHFSSIYIIILLFRLFTFFETYSSNANTTNPKFDYPYLDNLYTNISIPNLFSGLQDENIFLNDIHTGFTDTFNKEGNKETINLINFPLFFLKANIKKSSVFINKPEKPSFSHIAGFYKDKFNLNIKHRDKKIKIIYTIDGSEPNLNNLDKNNEFSKTYLYSQAITIKSRKGESNLLSNIKTTDSVEHWLPIWSPPKGEVYKATVIKAKAVSSDTIYSETTTATYFVDQNADSLYKGIAVISLSADYESLFNDQTGIYVPGNTHKNIYDQNFFRKCWKSANIEFFDNKRLNGFNVNVQIKIQGASSNASPQKGISVKLDTHDSEFLNYPIFSNSRGKAANIKKFKHFIIRAWGSTQNWPVFFSDAFHQMMAINTNLDIQAYRPVIVFINGEYWGLHEIREANKKASYYQTHYGKKLKKNGIDIIDGKDKIIKGNNTEWLKLKNFILNNDLSLDENYSFVEKSIDIKNFIEYIIHCTYTGKSDWPGQNEAIWRLSDEKAKWKWIQYDMDIGLNENATYYNSTQTVFQVNQHKLLSKLIKNAKFKNIFLNTYADFFNSIFSPKEELQLFDAMASELAPYIEEHKKRWLVKYDWIQGLSFGRNIILNRRQIRLNQLKSYFKLNEEVIQINVSNKKMGYVKINSIILKDIPNVSELKYPWTGIYFKEVPIDLEAFANKGYRFIGWKLDNNEVIFSTNSSLQYTISSKTKITAIFE